MAGSRKNGCTRKKKVPYEVHICSGSFVRDVRALMGFLSDDFLRRKKSCCFEVVPDFFVCENGTCGLKTKATAITGLMRRLVLFFLQRALISLCGLCSNCLKMMSKKSIRFSYLRRCPRCTRNHTPIAFFCQNRETLPIQFAKSSRAHNLDIFCNSPAYFHDTSKAPL